ncbi:MAG: DUF2164 domain-containing protein [Candidatus Magasanikbacteria bacterium]
MDEIKRKWDFLPKDKRETSIEKIISFFDNERDEQIGVIAAEEILDFFLDNIGEHIYNEGIDNASAALRQHSDDIEIDLDLLKQK